MAHCQWQSQWRLQLATKPESVTYTYNSSKYSMVGKLPKRKTKPIHLYNEQQLLSAAVQPEDMDYE